MRTVSEILLVISGLCFIVCMLGFSVFVVLAVLEVKPAVDIVAAIAAIAAATTIPFLLFGLMLSALSAPTNKEGQ